MLIIPTVSHVAIHLHLCFCEARVGQPVRRKPRQNQVSALILRTAIWFIIPTLIQTHTDLKGATPIHAKDGCTGPSGMTYLVMGVRVLVIGPTVLPHSSVLSAGSSGVGFVTVIVSFTACMQAPS
jgi:hypothetical protein